MRHVHMLVTSGGHWRPAKRTHHGFQVLWPQGRKLQVQVTKALKAIQELTEDDGGLVQRQHPESICGEVSRRVLWVQTIAKQV